MTRIDEVFAGSLCHFNRALIVLQESIGVGSILKHEFTKASFWVQIHNVMDIDTIREI